MSASLPSTTILSEKKTTPVLAYLFTKFTDKAQPTCQGYLQCSYQYTCFTRIFHHQKHRLGSAIVLLLSTCQCQIIRPRTDSYAESSPKRSRITPEYVACISLAHNSCIRTQASIRYSTMCHLFVQGLPRANLYDSNRSDSEHGDGQQPWPSSALTSLPVFLIFSSNSSYPIVPLTRTSCLSRLTSYELMPVGR